METRFFQAELIISELLLNNKSLIESERQITKEMISGFVNNCIYEDKHFQDEDEEKN